MKHSRAHSSKLEVCATNKSNSIVPRDVLGTMMRFTTGGSFNAIISREVNILPLGVTLPSIMQQRTHCRKISFD